MFGGQEWGGSLFFAGGGKGRLIMAYKNVPIGMDVGFHLRAPKFKWSQLQDAPSCSKGGIRGWWEGVKGFRRRGGGEGVGGMLVVEILATPSYPLGRPPLKATDPLWSSLSPATSPPPDPPPCPGHAR